MKDHSVSDLRICQILTLPLPGQCAELRHGPGDAPGRTDIGCPAERSVSASPAFEFKVNRGHEGVTGHPAVLDPKKGGGRVSYYGKRYTFGGAVS